MYFYLKGMKAIEDFGLMEDAAALLLGLSSKYIFLSLSLSLIFSFYIEFQSISYPDSSLT